MGNDKGMDAELEVAAELLKRAAKRIRELEAKLDTGTKPSRKGGKYHGLGRTPVNGTYAGHVPAGAEAVTANPITWPARPPKTKRKVPSKPEYPVNDMDRYVVLLARKASKDEDWARVSRKVAARRRLSLMQIRGVLAEATKRNAR